MAKKESIIEKRNRQVERLGGRPKGLSAAYNNIPCLFRRGEPREVLKGCKGCQGTFVGFDCTQPRLLRKPREQHIAIIQLKHRRERNTASEQGYFVCEDCELRRPYRINDEPTWSVAITTAPRKMQTLSQSLKSLKSAGWRDRIAIFAEPGSWVPENDPDVEVYWNKLQFGAWQNWRKAMRFLAAQDSDLVMICQDDAIYTPGLKLQLELTWPEGAQVVSPYGCSRYAEDPEGYTPHMDGWFYGAVCWVFAREVAEDCIKSKKIRDYDKSHAIDAIVPSWLKSTNRPIYSMRPSQVNHIGETSTLWPDKGGYMISRSAVTCSQSSPVYLPFRGEFGHKLMWHVPWIYSEHAERVCCHEGEEALFPRAKSFHYVARLCDRERGDRTGSDETYIRGLERLFALSRRPMARQPNEKVMRGFERFIPTPHEARGIRSEIVLCPRAREVCPERNWSHWRRLAGDLSDLRLFAAGARESSVDLGIESAWDFERDIDSTIEAMLSARLVVSTDAGLGHLAMLCGRPLLVICHKRTVYRWRYRAANHVSAPLRFLNLAWDDPSKAVDSIREFLALGDWPASPTRAVVA